jgi:hypothetical protein
MRRSTRGLVILVAGPDGAGKPTLSRNLGGETEREVLVVAHSHWRPELLRRLLGEVRA